MRDRRRRTAGTRVAGTRSRRRRVSVTTLAIVAALLGPLAVIAPAARAAAYTGGLAPAIVGGLLDMNGSGRVGGRDDSNGFYGNTHVIDGHIDCDAWARPNDGVVGDKTIDGRDDCLMVGVDGSIDGTRIVVEDGVVVAIDDVAPTDGTRMPALFNASAPADPDPRDADFGWWVYDGRVDANANEAIDEFDCARGVVGAVDDEGLGPPADGADVIASSPACSLGNVNDPGVDGLVDLDSDGRITAKDTCTDGCFVGRDVAAGSVRGPDGGTGPAIASFSPPGGPAGTRVTITGTGLSGATVVRFNGVAAEVISATGTAVVVVVPVGATTGRITVVLPTGPVTSDDVFTVSSTPPPPTGVHERAVTLELVRSLVAQGVVTVADGTSACADRALVRIQRKVGQRWTTIQSTRTNAAGV